MTTDEKKCEMPQSLRSIVLIELLLPLLLLLFGAYHGVLQVLYRAGVIRATSFAGIDYYQGLTAHGVINAIVLTTLFGATLGNVIVSQELGGLSIFGAGLSLALMVIGAVVAAAMIFVGKATVLYTFYPPLKAHPLFYLGLAVFIVGSWIAFYAWIPAYRRWRRSHPQQKTPIGVVGMFSAFIIWQICTIPVAVEVLVLLLPWSMGWTAGIDVVLSRTLFWFFGHALVYFWLLPTYVLYYTMLPKLAGGKLFSDFAARFTFLSFIVLSIPIGLHHQFADPGIAASWKGLQMALTLLVAVPSMMTAFTLAASLEIGARQAGGRGLFAWWSKLPYVQADRWMFAYLFCGLAIFLFGGITGLINAAYSMNNLIHNTAWLPAHFHLTVGGPVFLAILGMSLFLVAGLLNKPVALPKLALSVPYLWTIGTFIFSGGLFVGGLRGEPRRTNLGLTYLNPSSTSYRPDWWITTHIGALGGCIMGLAILIYFVVLVRTIAAHPSQAYQRDSALVPMSAVYHDENVPALRNFSPWIVAAVLLIAVAYYPPIHDIMKNNFKPAPAYTPESPTVIGKAP